MSRALVSRTVAAWFAILWAAVVLRVDQFPLSWAPMYSRLGPSESGAYDSLRIDRPMLDRRGWRVTYRNGETGSLARSPLNLPRRSMWRYYYRATFDDDTARVSHVNERMGDFARGAWGLEPEEEYLEIDWRRRLFHAVNRTLRRGPNDACFIVRFEAERETQHFAIGTLEELPPTPESARADFDPAWARDYPQATPVAAPPGGCSSLLGKG
jgi:hypothetical protein